MSVRPFRTGFTIGQMMKAVALAAVVCFGMLPIFTPDPWLRLPWWVWLFYESLTLPILLAAVSVLVLRPGMLKTWAISALLTLPIVLIVALFGVMVAWFAIRSWNSWRTNGSFILPTPRDVIATLVLGSILLGSLAFLLRRVVPARCPSCGRRRLLREGSIGLNDRTPRARCLDCQAGAIRSGRRWRRIEPTLDGWSAGPSPG